MTSLHQTNNNVTEEEKSDLYEQLHQSEEGPPVYQNAPPRRRTFSKVDWKELPDRFIVTGYPDLALPDNSIQTTKYNVMNFIPKNLMEQFSKLANVYFLIIGVLQAIPPISTSNGKPVIYFPLAFILLVSAIKDLVEDLKRRADDKKENFGRTQKLTPNGFVECKWMDIRVGDIVKVENNEYIPADMVLLKTSEANGTCFTETKNLDGETNLKPRIVDKALLSYFNNDTDLLNKRIEVNYERPNPYLYTFRGNMKLQNGKEIALTNNNFLLRACSLKSPYAIGLVAYTGHETKIMLNSVSARGKSSKLERQMNKQIILIFLLQNVLCCLIALYATIWNWNKYDDINKYLFFGTLFGTYFDTHPILYSIGYFLMKYGNWLVIFTNFVPISLLVTLEMVKFIQAKYVMKDPRMTDDVNGTEAVVQTSRLMEELGQVNYIFSDKTGTLTCNIMEFKKLCILGETYGDDRSHDVRKQPTVSNVDFIDAEFFNVLQDPGHLHFHHAHEILFLLSTCHSINIDETKGSREYSASSPDELALVNFAKYCNYEYIGKTEKDELLLKIFGKDQKHRLLHMLEFDSDRKRMSVVLENDKGQIILYCKGADSIIMDRMCKNSNPHIDKINAKVEEYANVGLRTLLIAKREIDKDLYMTWADEYHKACSSIKDREAAMAKLQEEIEQNLVVMGATAIEDKLQDRVGDTIYACREAGMKVWVLTGDKTETAINIGHSCKLLDHTQKIFIIDVQSPEELLKRIAEVEDQARHRLEREKGAYALVITGKSLIYSHHGGEHGELSNRLYNIFSKADAVVACRVSPKQKRDIVELVKGKVPEAVTLAIGDGANDVNMITAAHIGVGIKGLEGYQAARASDFAIGEFKLLRRLLLFYGREAYRKNSILVLYNFFKNQVLILPQFWYGFMNGFSGTALYEAVIFQLYNICYSSLPIVIFAVTDKEFNGSFLERNPKYYKPGLSDNFFNMRLFWRWFSAGSIQAIVIVTTAFLALSTNFVTTDGYMVGFFSSGMMAYSSLIICANLKILLFSSTISVLNLFFIFGSILFYIGNFTLFDTFKSSPNYGEFGKIYGTWNYYWGTGIMVGLTTILDFAISRWRFTNVMSTDKAIELQIRKQSMKRSGQLSQLGGPGPIAGMSQSRNFSIMQEDELSL